MSLSRIIQVIIFLDKEIQVQETNSFIYSKTKTREESASERRGRFLHLRFFPQITSYTHAMRFMWLYAPYQI